MNLQSPLCLVDKELSADGKTHSENSSLVCTNIAAKLTVTVQCEM